MVEHNSVGQEDHRQQEVGHDERWGQLVQHRFPAEHHLGKDARDKAGSQHH
jgi:hypothetical protein